jgi:hypothetical protein
LGRIEAHVSAARQARTGAGEQGTRYPSVQLYPALVGRIPALLYM